MDVYIKEKTVLIDERDGIFSIVMKTGLLKTPAPEGGRPHPTPPHYHLYVHYRVCCFNGVLLLIGFLHMPLIIRVSPKGGLIKGFP